MPRPPRQVVETAKVAFDIAWMDRDGVAKWDCLHLPDLPALDGAVVNLARGAVLRRPLGDVAIEDLMPGDRVATASGGTVQIDWIGSRTIFPGTGSRAAAAPLYRIAAGAFGNAGPHQDTVVGAHARVLIQSPRCRDLVGTPTAFAPVAAFEDGSGVCAIHPPGAVTVYGIACSGQEAVLVGGLPLETYHPARATSQSLNRSVLSELARLFPHLSDRTGFSVPRIPHLSMTEAQELAVRGVWSRR